MGYKCPIKKRENSRKWMAQWRAKNPTKVSENNKWENLRKRFKMTRRDWESRLKAQDYCCANPGCRAPYDPTINGGWHVDHDHACCSESRTCGKCIRGILCRGCNDALGKIKDSVARLGGLIRYLGETA